jgi:hypothetical protein
LHSIRSISSLLLFVLCLTTISFTQTETATVSGRVTDQQGGLVQGVELVITNVDTNLSSRQTTNTDGLYVLSGLKPGRYRISVTKGGFRSINLTDVILNVQDSISQNFKLRVGSVSESVTVVADAANVNTTDAAVSTVVDRQFAENLPMNGRSFQTLIQLTPGVVLATTNGHDSGQFSVNGQRAASNYWMVDGVSANVGVGNPGNGSGNGGGGALAVFSVQGGTNSLVSVDAMQEFRIQTSTYAPEFGRTPGGQISIVTRSGANQFHGTAFDYLRNDKLDANDWFANFTKQPKPPERQNDFGGTFSGPIFKDKSFFFFSYEGLRLRLPQVAQTIVPSVSSRQGAIPDTQSLLNAFPVPNGTDLGNGTAQFNASFSNSSALNATSLRLDHKVTDKVSLFGRYNYSPSELLSRDPSSSLSTLSDFVINTQTATVGTTWTISSAFADELRFNYSRSTINEAGTMDAFGGAAPLTSFPGGFTPQNAGFGVVIASPSQLVLNDGQSGRFVQRQFNFVDTLSLQKSSHSLKFGVDYRRLRPSYNPASYRQIFRFADISSADAGMLSSSDISSNVSVHLRLQNLGLYAQDTWRLKPRITLTYGLRWDVDYAPTSNPILPAITNFGDLSILALAPNGTPVYGTRYGNIAPRVGLAYELVQSGRRELVLRGGFGVFFDLASSEVGNALPGFGADNTVTGGTYPLSASQLAPPQVMIPGSGLFLTGYDPNLRLPHTLEWNVALEQALGTGQSITVSYVGAAGRRLLQSEFVLSPNPNTITAYLVGNFATSDYSALQLQFKRRLSRGLQALASYTWAHSIDTASAGSVFGGFSNALVSGINPSANRGPSDFDIRNAFSTGLTYDIPVPKLNVFATAILRGWSLENVIQARSAPPVNVYDGIFLRNSFTEVRPNVASGIPLYLYGPQFPGGKAINNTPGALIGGCADGSQSTGPFCPPTTDSNGNVQEGNLGRNALRAFPATQWDLAIHRDFPIRESLRLQFRAEMFNVLNHPNFGPPVSDLTNTAQFGRSTQMLGQSLAGGAAGIGAFSPLYQIGGPRSIQLALKLVF